MTYIEYLENFNRISTAFLIPAKVQFLYIKILMRFHYTNWPNCIEVSNLDMMHISCISNERDFIASRNYLIKAGFLEYEKGKKGSYGKYKLLDISKIINIPNITRPYTSESQLGRRSKDYNIWRNKVLERDNYTCQICGNKKYKLVAHHKKKWSKYPNLRFDVDNGITLCENCYISVHKGELTC